MSNAMPYYMYRDPAETLSRFEASTVYQKEGCSACRWVDMSNINPCIKKLSPGKHWCRGFEES